MEGDRSAGNRVSTISVVATLFALKEVHVLASPTISCNTAWVEAMRIVYRAGLDVLGITATERLERLDGATALEGASSEVGHPG